jgi:hypothetical protein
VCDAWSGVSFGVHGEVRMYSRVVGCGGIGERGDMVVIGCGFFLACFGCDVWGGV